jgi:hypothetical protein
MATYEKVSWFQRLKNDMKDMTFAEKLGHLWEYYKWFAIGAVVLIIVTISVVSSVIENSKELVYGGMVVNLTVSEEGNTYLKEGWFEALGADSDQQKIELDTMYMPDMDTPTYTETSRANVTKITTMITAGYVDYILADAYAVHYLCSGGSFSALDTVLPEEILEQFEGKLVTYEDDKETYLVAIDISDLPFVKEHVMSKDKTYIAFPGNTGRTERNAAFLQYLMNWSK